MHVSPLHEYEVFNKLSRLPEIIEVHPLFGEYDLIANSKQKMMKASEKSLFIKLKQ
jgi:DNA-binding Lrp family transcriptional regulator